MFTWCRQRMSALDAGHTEGKEVIHSTLPQGTANFHLGGRGYHEYTLGLCQHRRNLFGSGGCNS